MKIEIEVERNDLELLKKILVYKSDKNSYIKNDKPFIKFKDSCIGTIFEHPIKVYLDYEDYIYLRDLKEEIYG